MTVVVYAFAAFGLALCLVVLLLLAEVSVQAFTTAREDVRNASITPTYVVLVPAHNEAEIIAETVRHAVKQLAPSGRLLVVADNCTDDTARLAREAGAEVVERQHSTLRAKGFALAYGLEHLRGSPPEAVIMMDADCRAGDGTFDRIAHQTVLSMRPVQSVNLMVPSPGAKLRLRMAAFAWAVRNHLRPAGLARMSLPCQLTGTGMAFAWPLLESVDFATGSLVEDLRLGLEFARRHAAPELHLGAIVTSKFPESREGEQSQRRRWEHGHMESILRNAPPLIVEALRRRNLHLFVLACDMCVPPLALLALIIAGYSILGLAMVIWTPAALPILALASLSATTFALAVAVGWHSAGRAWVSASELLSAPLYALRKLPLYLGFVTNRQRVWTRTKRGE
jgi:cellulose synthase/poly-beta-1,6-N-acetylglucosamine synthase-like glycosyltransferase